MHELSPNAAPWTHDILERFESQWQAGTPPVISQFLDSLGESASPAHRRALLHELVAVDLWHRWTRLSLDSIIDVDALRSRPCLDDYARQFAELGPLAELPASVIREEYRVRRMQGESITPGDYRQRFAGRDDFLGELEDLERELASDRTSELPGENGTESPSASKELTVRCPNCQSEVATVADALETVLRCSSCGSSIRLVGECADLRAFSAGHAISQFQLLDKLGMGSFGTVWRARDTRLDRDVAIKIPRYGQLEQAEIAIFLREARSAAQLHHPNIVAVHEVGLAGDVPYIVSDLVRGLPLSEHLNNRRFTADEAVRLCAQVADALHHAHEAGVVHRDLKPGNLLLDTAGELHLTDFGLARRPGAEATLTTDGQILGTPAYMSPEQARGDSHHADRRSDIYSLGTILYLLLTGELPFRGSAEMMMLQIIRDDPPSPRKLVGGLARDLETICLKCLEKEPGKRYATAADLADDLRRYLRGAPISARPIGHVERTWKLCRAHPMAASLVASTILFLSVLVVGLLAWNMHSSRILSDLAESVGDVAALEMQLGNAAEAHTQFKRVVQTLERITPIPDSALSRAYNRLGFLGTELRDPQAEQYLSQARVLQQKLLSSGPPNYQVERDLWESTLYRGDARLKSAHQDLEGATSDYREAVRLAEANLSQRSPLYSRQLDDAATSYERLATALVKKRNIDEARALYLKSLKLRSDLATSQSHEPRHQQALALIYDRMGRMWLGLHHPDQAYKCLEQSQGIRRRLNDSLANAGAQRIEILTTYGLLARTEEVRLNYDEAIRWCDKVLEVWDVANRSGLLMYQPRMIDLREQIVDQRARCELKRRAMDNLEAALADHPESKAELIQAYCLQLGRKGEFDLAEAAARRLAALPDYQPAALDVAAFTFARLAQMVGEQVGSEETSDRAETRKRFANRAVELLSQAHGAGAYERPDAPAYLRYSQGYCDLRSRADFAHVVEQVDASPSASTDGSAAPGPRTWLGMPTYWEAEDVSH